MTIRHLKIFLTVLSEGGMTKAADKLHITQPSVSLAIKELEEHYQTKLYERLGHKLFLTAAGEKLAECAKRMLHIYEHTENVMNNENLSRLRIGASLTVGESLLIGWLQRLKEQNPQADIFAEIDNTAELESLLLQDKLDLAVVEGKISSPYLREKHLYDDELIFVAGKNKLPAQLNADALAELSFFVREQGSGTRMLFEQVMAEKGIVPQLAGVFSNAESIKKAVALGLGVTAISRRSVQEELQAGKLAEFKVPGLEFKRDFRLVYHKDKFFTALMQSFAAML